jgi:hypothetical protein
VTIRDALRFADADASNYVAFKSSATVSSNITWTLPAADGTTGQVLSTNGSGTLSWATGGGGGSSITAGDSKVEVTDTGSNGTIVFNTDGSERMRVDSSGNVLVGITTARANAGDVQVSKGISFPATQSAQSDANTLDDYEEGDWTPNVGGNATYDANTYGKYTKIGNIVTCQFRLAITTIGTGSPNTLSGLPFPSSSSGGISVQSGHCSFYSGLAINTIYLAFYVGFGVSTITFVSQASSGATVTNGPSLMGDNTTIAGQVTYRV